MSVQIGDDQPNLLTGVPGETNRLEGRGANDTLIGADQADTLLGGFQDDLALGAAGQDSIDGERGNDTLFGGAESDTLLGGAGEGADHISGEAGDDLIDGGAGNDDLGGGTGNDTITAGAGDDTVSGGDGADSIRAGSGNDTINAGSGDNFVRAGDGDDLVTANGGNDNLRGADGNDTILAGDGNNTIAGGAGDDLIAAGSGDDRVTWAAGDGNDTITLGGGLNTLVLENFGGVNDPGDDWEVSLPAGPGPGVATFTHVPTGAVLTVSDWQRATDTVICFYPGTLVATPDGARPVESLRPGEAVLTMEGATRSIRWMGRQTVSTRFGDPVKVLPIRIRAGALAEGLPTRDLLVSPAHALLVRGVLVQAGALVNGSTILREHAVPTVFTYWHVELETHELILAEGVPAETFVDTVARENFDNWAERAGMPDADRTVPEMDRPRARSHRQVPLSVRAALAARVAALTGAADSAA